MERSMSLVDYASSSSEEDEAVKHDGGGEYVAPAPAKEDEGRKKGADAATASCTPASLLRSSSPQDQQNRNREMMTNVQPASVVSQSVPLIELPDASLLFSSPSISSQQISVNDHSSRVAAAKTINLSRRESNRLAVQVLQNKKPRVNSPDSRNAVAKTTGLVPPQLLGRSNVVTEDVGKLFVHRDRRSGASQ